jgi:superfamily II DNA or RNA helicase
MGKSVWNVSKDIVLWQKKGNSLIVPFGMLNALRSIGISVGPTEHLIDPITRFKGKVDGLYDYQRKALESALKASNGVLVAPCGSGKTQIGIAICATLGCRTLWLTHTQELLKQSMARAKAYLDIHMGTITGGKVNVSNNITFATVQTMAKIDLSEFKYFWDVIIVDECHRCVGTPTQMTMFWKVVNSLSARYKYGLTATPKRSDGMQKAMFALLGPKFFEITREDVKANTCPLNVLEPIPTGWTPDIETVLKPDGTLDYVSLITDCVNDESRNNIISTAIDCAADDGPTLVLSERISHLEKLAGLCKYSNGNLSS